VAGSNHTRDRLAKYAELAVIIYVQAMKDTLANGATLSKIVRSQQDYLKVKERVMTFWKMQSMNRKWVDEVLPKL
jgi:hypothetical protein